MEPKPAATVIVARAAARGIEVLVLRRTGTSRFAPGFVVFPGGVVEPSDRDLAMRLFGDPEEAPRACAVRELYEETGLLLTARALRTAIPDRPIEAVSFEPPPIEALHQVARWVAPSFLEVRFDARFFATAAPPRIRPVPDGIEAEAAWWARPSDVLASAEGGDAPLMWPTLVMLRALEGCPSVDDVLGLDVPQVPRDPSIHLPAP
jgi:recombination protein RecT